MASRPRPRRVVAARDHEAERVAERRLGARVGGERRDRLAGLEDPGLLDAGAGQVADVVAGQVGGAVSGEERGDDDEEDHALHRTRTSAIRGAAVLASAVDPAAVGEDERDLARRRRAG